MTNEWRHANSPAQSGQHDVGTYSGPASDAIRAQLALIGGDMGSFEWDIPAGLVYCDARLADDFGLPPGHKSYSIEDFFARIHPDDVPAIEMEVDRAIEERVDYHMEWRVIKNGGEIRWVGGRGRIVERDPTGGALRMLGVNWDVTERKEQEQALKALAMEMEHRVKNAFAMVSALTGMAARRCETPEEMKETLRGQIRALGKAHSLGVSGTGVGDRGDVIIADLIRTALAPWDALHPELSLQSQVTVSAQAGASLAMLLYELTTNATKYGGLSDEGAKLSVSLQCQANGDAVLTWCETMPSRAPRLHSKSGLDGYGTILLAQAAQTLDAELTRLFHPDGLRLILTIPVHSLKSQDAIMAKVTA